MAGQPFKTVRTRQADAMMLLTDREINRMPFIEFPQIKEHLLLFLLLPFYRRKFLVQLRVLLQEPGEAGKAVGQHLAGIIIDQVRGTSHCAFRPQVRDHHVVLVK